MQRLAVDPKGKAETSSTSTTCVKAASDASCLPSSNFAASGAAGLPAAPVLGGNPSRKRPRIRKLAPPRPFPAVPLGRSATGPRSTHASPDEPMCICVTRRTTLAAYISRCKTAILNHGVRELRLCAMGAAIPHLALLVGSLSTSGVLPYGEDELNVQIYTGSVSVRDEVLSESEDDGEEGGGAGEAVAKEEFRTRVKSVMNAIIRVGDAAAAASRPESGPGRSKGRRRTRARKKGQDGEQQANTNSPRRIVLQEPEQEDMDET